ncbi:UNVERIFIED_CONTAM: 4-oxalocrotonate tautomerase [Acetivibrio alkalicellulosi]
MPVINITLWKGRTQKQKLEFAQSITKEMVRLLNVKESSVQVVYHEISKEDWIIGGKILD